MCEVDERFPPVMCGAICDFCSSPKVFQIFMAEDFTAVELEAPNGYPAYLNSTGGWAACHECAKLVEAAKWDELLERCFHTFKASLPPFVYLSKEEEHALKGLLRGAHEQFRKLRKTPV